MIKEIETERIRYMVESINAAQPLPHFTTLVYTTKDGEKVTATKNNGIVTIQGEKSGIRQMPLDDFIQKELKENLKEISLEKSPQADTVEISQKAEDKSEVKDEKVAEKPAQATEAKTEEKPEVGQKLDVAA